MSNCQWLYCFVNQVVKCRRQLTLLPIQLKNRSKTSYQLETKFEDSSKSNYYIIEGPDIQM